VLLTILVGKQMFNNGMTQGNTKMKSVLSNVITLLILILGSALPLANSAPVGAFGRVSVPTAPNVYMPGGSPAQTIGLSLGFAMADFTGDTHPDLATIALNAFDSAHAEYAIEVQLSEGGHQLLRLTAPFGGILITPKDVTGDGNLDLVIRSARSHLPVAVFLNDGRGHFSAVDPTAFRAALRETTPDYGFSTNYFYFNATFVSPKSYTAHGRSGSARANLEPSDFPVSANNRIPVQLYLYSGLNRAPPAAA
jgi:hypothetical protein